MQTKNVDVQTQLLLAKALELFGEDGEHWTKGTYCRAVDGKPTKFDGSLEEIDKMCSIGALLVAERILKSSKGAYANARIALTRKIPRHTQHIAYWNDIYAQSFSEVKEVFIRAIQSLCPPATPE